MTTRLLTTSLSAVLLLPASARAQQIAADLLPQDLSPIGMFLAADIVVKSVMIGLAIASVVTWTVLIVKGTEIWLANRHSEASSRQIAVSDTLDEALERTDRRRDAAAYMLRLAAEERARSFNSSNTGLKERVASHLAGVVAGEGRNAAMGTGLLASIGAVAPFVGLFGTVWGIMNSFIGISEAQTTNLAVVAPGIAEALLATALGLVAAIPAVVIYNALARVIASYRLRLSRAAAGVERLISRDLDHGSFGGQ